MDVKYLETISSFFKEADASTNTELQFVLADTCRQTYMLRVTWGLCDRKKENSMFTPVLLTLPL